MVGQLPLEQHTGFESLGGNQLRLPSRSLFEGGQVFDHWATALAVRRTPGLEHGNWTPGGGSCPPVHPLADAKSPGTEVLHADVIVLHTSGFRRFLIFRRVPDSESIRKKNALCERKEREGPGRRFQVGKKIERKARKDPFGWFFLSVNVSAAYCCWAANHQAGGSTTRLLSVGGECAEGG